ncbi:TPA: hypothetical protein N0F65_002231 [Lagenidium giganteum]|uniref:WW domain-containing protein n=1 Tax=Lagenidium giganteum TaxID=4803 RepID=A0AAV2YRI3_9STRA|nr:TPA: hypothetical protein N0F65_002231 [Lagenidium giganteum]
MQASSQAKFDEIERIQHQLACDFDQHDERQVLFKKKFARETRKARQTIYERVCGPNASTTSASDTSKTMLLAAHQNSLANEDTEAEYVPPVRRTGPERVTDDLKCFYSPPDATTDILCDTCYAFRCSSLVQPLPAPWQEFVCEMSHNHYYYHPDTKQVRWSPPLRDTHPWSMLVFARTNSVFTVCHCIPSQDRRRRLLLQFREFAFDTARIQSEKRQSQLHGAFRSLALTMMDSKVK